MTGCQPVSASRLLACYSGESNEMTGKLPIGRVRLGSLTSVTPSRFPRLLQTGFPELTEVRLKN